MHKTERVPLTFKAVDRIALDQFPDDERSGARALRMIKPTIAHFIVRADHLPVVLHRESNMPLIGADQSLLVYFGKNSCDSPRSRAIRSSLPGLNADTHDCQSNTA